jgi:hypothetical protein
MRIGYRTIKNWTGQSFTKRAAFLEMLNEDFEFFPTLR